jgi:hypothetical protein
MDQRNIFIADHEVCCFSRLCNAASAPQTVPSTLAAPSDPQARTIHLLSPPTDATGHVFL